MTAPHDALSLSVNFNDGTGVVALQMTYTWVGPGFGESLPAPIATLTAPTGASLWSVHYQTSEAAPADAYGGQFYLRQGTGDPAAPTWGPWILWVEQPAGAWSGGFSSTLTVPAALTAPDTLLAVDPPLHDQYQSTCLDCVDSGPIRVSRSGGDPSWARYLVAYTWVDAAGHETRAQTVVLDSASLHGGTAASTSTWQAREKHFAIIPAGATAARWYVRPPLDASDPASALAGWLHAIDIPVIAGTLADWTLSVAEAGAWPAAALPALNATCRAGWLRLRHASGQSYIQQNGVQVQVRAEDVDVLYLPLPVLAAAPATLVGRDPASGLPAFCPRPAEPASGSKPTPPATGTDCTQTRCGAALAMTQHLEDLYDTWRTWINAAIGAVASLSIGVILDWLEAFIGALVVAERIASSTLTIFNNLRPLLAALTGVELSGVLPVWDSTTVDNVQRVFFGALQCTGTDVSVSADDLTNVAGYIRANTASFLGNIVSELLALSCEYSALTDWQAKITGATPSGLCAGY